MICWYTIRVCASIHTLCVVRPSDDALRKLIFYWLRPIGHNVTIAQYHDTSYLTTEHCRSGEMNQLDETVRRRVRVKVTGF